MTDDNLDLINFLTPTSDGRERWAFEHDSAMGGHWRVWYGTLSEFNNYAECGHGSSLSEAIRDIQERLDCPHCAAWRASRS